MDLFGRFRRQRVEFAEPDRLVRAIQQAIDELMAEGVIKREAEAPEETGAHRYDGFCARAVQAYWRFTRDPEYAYLADYPSVEPWQLGTGKKGHHWLRIKGTDKILDLNIGPDEEPDLGYRYDKGRQRKQGYQPRTAGSNIPHRNDAQMIMERVRRNNPPVGAAPRSGNS